MAGTCITRNQPRPWDKVLSRWPGGNTKIDQLSPKYTGEQLVGDISSRFEFADGEVDIGAWDKTSLLAPPPV